MQYTGFYCSVIALGAILSGGRNLSRFQRPLVVVVIFHLVGAVFVGALAGQFGRWATTRLRGVVLGTLIGLPISVVLGLVFRPEYSIETLGLGATASAIILGGGFGWIIVDDRLKHS